MMILPILLHRCLRRLFMILLIGEVWPECVFAFLSRGGTFSGFRVGGFVKHRLQSGDAEKPLPLLCYQIACG